MPRLTETLDRYRGVLGELRADRLEAMAAELREGTRDLGTGELRGEAMRLGDPFLHLDRDGARETLRIERDKEVVNERIDAAEAEAQGLEAQAAQTPGMRRRARSALVDTAHAQRLLAERDLDRLGALHEVESDLRERGRHLDGWWDEHAEDAARRMAIDDELADRYEQELDDELPAYDLEPDLDLEVPVPPSLQNVSAAISFADDGLDGSRRRVLRRRMTGGRDREIRSREVLADADRRGEASLRQVAPSDAQHVRAHDSCVRRRPNGI